MQEIQKVNTEVLSALSITAEKLENAQKLDAVVLAALQYNTNSPFTMALVKGEAITKLAELMSTGYMETITKLRGNKLGFLTDMDTKSTPYSDDVTKMCVIEALLSGFQVYGNQFNIIGGKMYPTKEGYITKLGNIDNLYYDTTFKVPKIDELGITTVEVYVEYKSEEMSKMATKTLTFPIKVNSGMGNDAIIGKAERKALAWIHKKITGTDLGEVDVTEQKSYPIETKTETPKPSEESKPTETTRNEHIEEVEHVEETSQTKPIETISTTATPDDIKKGNEFLSKAANKESLEKRYKGLVDKFKSFPDEIYKTLLGKF